MLSFLQCLLLFSLWTSSHLMPAVIHITFLFISALLMFLFLSESPGGTLFLALVLSDGTRGSPAQARDYLGGILKVGEQQWAPMLLASLLTQSKNCTWRFISSSSLSLLSVGEHTQKVLMNYKLSGPAPWLIIMHKSKYLL